MSGYKTLIVALVSLLGGVLQMLGHGVPEETLRQLAENLDLLVGGLMTLYGLVMGVLRLVTTGPAKLPKLPTQGDPDA